MSAFADVATKCNARIAAADTALHTVLSSVPNLLCDSVPDGSDASHNVQVKVWEPSGVGLARKVSPEGDGTYAWHDELLHALGAWGSGTLLCLSMCRCLPLFLFTRTNPSPSPPSLSPSTSTSGANGADPEAAARISGGRFSVLCGHTARLERALLAFFLDFQAARGYAEVSVPYIVTRSALEGTGQLPKFEEDLFRVSHQVAGEDAFLIPTAEVPVTNLLRGQLLDAAALPLKYVFVCVCVCVCVCLYNLSQSRFSFSHSSPSHRLYHSQICVWQPGLPGRGWLCRARHARAAAPAPVSQGGASEGGAPQCLRARARRHGGRCRGCSGGTAAALPDSSPVFR